MLDILGICNSDPTDQLYVGRRHRRLRQTPSRCNEDEQRRVYDLQLH